LADERPVLASKFIVTGRKSEKKLMISFQKILVFIFLFVVPVFSWAQEAIISIEEDDVLPISSVRMDDVVEPPKENFTSSSKSDMWEQYESGELDEKAYVLLQDEYNATASKDPKTRAAWLKRQNVLKRAIAKKNQKKPSVMAKKEKPSGRDIASEKKKSLSKKGTSQKVVPKKSDTKKVLKKTVAKNKKNTTKASGQVQTTLPQKRLPASLPPKVIKPQQKPSGINSKILEDDFKPVN